MMACTRCPPACHPAGSRRSRRARWRSGSPASRSCPSHPACTPRKGSLVHRVLELLFLHPPARAHARHGPGRVRTRPSPSTRSTPSSRCCGSTTTQEAGVLRRVLVARRRPYFAHGGPDLGPRDRARAAARGAGRDPRRCAASSTGSSSTTTAGWSSPTTRPGARPACSTSRAGCRACTSTRSCARQVLGQRPTAIRLMYLRTGETITATPSAQSVRFITTRTTAVWKAVERACLTGNFQPRPGALCNSCAFQPWCPAFGGDPALAADRGARAVRAGQRRRSARCMSVVGQRSTDGPTRSLERLRGNRLTDTRLHRRQRSSATSA